MKKGFYLSALIVLLVGCKKENQKQSLSDYISQNSNLVQDELIACAAGTEEGLDGDSEFPTSVFFYPVLGATEFHYFEASKLKDSSNFDKYIRKELTDKPVFNGYLWKYNNVDFKRERMGVVTYKTDGKLHICTPIRLKTNVKPTEINHEIVTVTENGITPTFSWEDGEIKENVIYFQVVSDLAGNLISGTYTYDKTFTFYNEDNVVLNISPNSPTPQLESNNTYLFTLMAVSEDNWVNLFAQKEFSTN